MCDQWDGRAVQAALLAIKGVVMAEYEEVRDPWYQQPSWEPSMLSWVEPLASPRRPVRVEFHIKQRLLGLLEFFGD